MKKTCSLFILLLILGCHLSGQSTGYGINYQAVARDNFGKEIANKSIDVKFSVISGNPLKEVVYQELHSDVRTSRYGVFSLIIGKGTPVDGLYNDLSSVRWADAAHYLKVEVKFNDTFNDMGTMQFMAVPYALYALKSLEAGPQGPSGPPGPAGAPGDPATDDQTLSFNGSNLTISGGNTVNLNSLINDADADPANELQDLIFENNTISLASDPTPTTIDLSQFRDDADADPANELQDLEFTDNVLSLSGDPTSTEVDLSHLQNDADLSPSNEIQDLKLTGHVLTVTNKISATPVDLEQYLDNTDTDDQTLSFNPATSTLSISEGNSVSIGSRVSFRASKTAINTGAHNTYLEFIPDVLEYNDGSGYNQATGEFVASETGLFMFEVKYVGPAYADAQKISIYKNGNSYDIIATGINGGNLIFRNFTLRLLAGDKIRIAVYTGSGGAAGEVGTGYFSGFRIY